MTSHVPAPLPQLGDHHVNIVGGTRRGKSGLAQLLASASPPGFGFTAIDPHGSFVRSVRDDLANPLRGKSERVVHYIDAGSDAVIGINPLEPHSDTPEGWHDAAVVLVSAIESRFEASPEETPRLSRLIYVGGYLCAQHRLSMVELLTLLSNGGDVLRATLLEGFNPDDIIRRELEDLNALAERSPRDFIALVESCKNRLVRWLGDRRLRRMLGQTTGISPLAVMDGAEIVLADLSALTYSDAALVGTILATMFVTAARRRPPLTGAPHRLIIDEAESMLSVDVARGLDQVAKNRLYLMLIIQRLGQLRNRGDFLADAVFVNCGVKICFGGLDPESARFMAEMLFAGHIDLQEWKPDSARPTVVSLDRVTLTARSRGTHRVEGHGVGEGSVRSLAEFSAATDTFLSSWGTVLSGGSTATMMATPADTLISTGVSDASARQRSGGRARGRARGRQSGAADVHTRQTTFGRGDTEAVSEAEAFIPRYESLPQQMYSLEEQIARAAWELMALPRRHCVIRVESDPPIRTMTRDLEPAFRSQALRDQCLPLYLARLRTASRYARSAADVDADISARLQRLITSAAQPPPDFASPEPAPRVIALTPRPFFRR